MKRLIYILLFLPLLANAQIGRYPFYVAPVISVPAGEYTAMGYPSALDTNTEAWYRGDTLVTYDGDDSISAVDDLSGNSPDIVQATGAAQPKFTESGILFDGSNDYMTMANADLDQPLSIYLVIKQESWVLNGCIMDGQAQNSCKLYQHTSTPGLGVYVTNTSGNNTNAPIGQFVVVTIKSNTTLNSFQINDTEAVTWEGSTNMNALSLGRKPAGTPYYSNFRLKELIIRLGTDDAGTTSAIKTYLKARNNVTY